MNVCEIQIKPDLIMASLAVIMSLVLALLGMAAVARSTGGGAGPSEDSNYSVQSGIGGSACETSCRARACHEPCPRAVRRRVAPAHGSVPGRAGARAGERADAAA